MSVRRPDYAIPFADILRPLTPAEYDALRESVKDHGNRIVTPVVVYRSKKHGEAIIDGQHRWKLSGELGIDCPVVDMGELTDTEAKALARQLNVARRHLKFDDWRQANDIDKQARLKLAKDMKKEGKSLQTIADKLGQSKSQTRRDLEEIERRENEDSGVPIGTPESESEQPAKTVGKDGKTYRQPPKAQPKPEAEPRPVNQPKPPAAVDPVQEPTIILPQPKPVPQTDAWGIEVQEHAAEAFGAVPKFLELLTLLKRVRGELTELCQSPGGVLLQKRCQWERSNNAAGGRWVLADLDNAIGVIEDAVPRHTDCPYHFNPHMDDHGKEGARPCPLCLNKRFTGDLKRRQVPPEMLKAMRDHYGVTEGGD